MNNETYFLRIDLIDLQEYGITSRDRFLRLGSEAVSLRCGSTLELLTTGFTNHFPEVQCIHHTSHS